MKKSTKIKIIDWTNKYIIWFFIQLIAIFWITGMLFELMKTLSKSDYSFFINYAQISLTLFGFTLIGAIFQRKKEYPKIIKKMFIVSILFLASAISFLFSILLCILKI